MKTVNIEIKVGPAYESGDYAGGTCLYRHVQIIRDSVVLFEDNFSGLTPGEDALECARVLGLIE